MQGGIEVQHSMIALIRVLFTTKLSKRSTSSVFLGLLIMVNVFGIIIGTIFLCLPKNTQIVIRNYGSSEGCRNAKQICQISFIVDEELEAPIRVYYQLQNFIANLKDYIHSKSRRQLSGIAITWQEAKSCHPYITNEQMNVSKSWDGHQLDRKKVASPCGLQAKYYFRDTFQLRNQEGRVLPFRTSGLLTMFSREPNSEHVQWVDPQLDSFSIWMTTSVSPVLQKMYGIIEENIPQGTYTLRINNIMDYGFNVQKNVMFQKQRNGLGDNKLLGYMIVGGSVTLLFLTILHILCIQRSCRWKG